ncbi:CocE/NonD family hydrolase [Mycolicibacterium sp.]|uniref:S15 peptidase family protein n=1 Tax=Mycolicibacterium sp. TaxID=2320850 RepID=UPI003D11D485
MALGIGAAMLAGAGAAVADDGTGATAGESSSESTSQSSETKASTSADQDAADDDGNTDENVVSGAEEAADAPDEVDTNAESAGEADVDEDAEPADETDPDIADEPDAEEPVAQKPFPAEDPAAEEPTVEPVDATTELTVPAAVTDPADPTLPAASLVMSLVTAGRDVTEEADAPAAKPSTTSAVDDWQIPTDVEVTEVIAPLQWIQRIPVAGPLLITPIVRLVHAIPFVGDLLHPILGWPVEHGTAPGTPQPRTFLVTSFDGARMFVHFMPAKGLRADAKAPTILSGPGLGLPGATTLDLKYDSFLPNDVIGIGALREAGYNVVTWDPRGEWRSEGRMQLQSPEYEGRDVSTIISWLATRPEVDAVDGDPKIGMVGASYGGGIQLATAAIDHRIDAIVPTIAWNNLVDVLFPRQAVRSSWATLLSSVLVLTLSRPHPQILPAALVAVLTGHVADDDIELLTQRGFADDIGNITAPTLLVQGTVDTLFTLAQADVNARALLAGGTTTKVVWYCGGHGTCLSDYNDGDLVCRETMEWLNRYVKGDTSVVTGPQFEWIDQHGREFSSDTYPLTPSGFVTAQRTEQKTIGIFPFIGGSGPNPLVVTRGLIAALLGLPSGAPATNAVNLRVPEAVTTTYILGAPNLTLTYSGTGSATHVYAQIVDNSTGLVLGNHVTPIPVVLDGDTHTVTVSLEQVAHTLAPGESLTVQLVTSAFTFQNVYSFGAITVREMAVELPTIAVGAGAAAA